MWIFYPNCKKNLFLKYVLGRKYVILYYEFKTFYSLYMKKILVLLFTCLFLFACGGNKQDVAKEEKQQNHVLVLYYSQTGATASVAKQIKARMNADIEEIVCEKPYSGDFNATIERCKKEQETGVIPAIKPIKADVQKYDIIFLGYPIWFGTYAPPVAALLDNTDFYGKMIVPFCTFGSGGLESSIENLKAHLPKAIIMEGFGIRNARLNRMNEELDDFLIRNGYLQGEVEALTDFAVQDELTAADKEVFHQACDDYPFPLGTPTSVSKRFRNNGTEYRFITRSSDDDTSAKMTVFIELRNEKDAKAEFTKVIR